MVLGLSSVGISVYYLGRTRLTEDMAHSTTAFIHRSLQQRVLFWNITTEVILVKVCDKSAAGFRRFCDLPTTENDVISEKET